MVCGDRGFQHTICFYFGIVPILGLGWWNDRWGMVSAPANGCPIAPSCPYMPRSILVLDGQLTAGLTDRLAALWMFSSLAAALCARLVVPPPCKMFSGAHTAGVNESVPWSHYVNLVHDDGSNPIIVDDGQEATRDAIVIGGLPSFSSELDAATNASRAGFPFIWNMRHLWYMVPEAYALMDYTNRCGLVRVSASAEASTVAAAVLSNLSLRAGTYVTMHVRRGDAKYACNTSVPELARYVQSSLHNLRNTSDQTSGSSADICTGGVLIHQNCTRALLLLTDETDASYVESLVARSAAAWDPSSARHGPPPTFYSLLAADYGLAYLLPEIHLQPTHPACVSLPVLLAGCKTSQAPNCKWFMRIHSSPSCHLTLRVTFNLLWQWH